MNWLLLPSRDLLVLVLVGLALLVSSVLSELECVTSEVTTTFSQTDQLTSTDTVSYTDRDTTVEIIVYITPYGNGTVASRTEYINWSEWMKREAATVTSFSERESSGLFNSSTKSTTEALTTCVHTTTIETIVTITLTTTDLVTTHIPGRTYTVASTLIDYDYLSPPVFQPTETSTNEVTTGLPVATLSPAPTTIVQTMPANTAQPSRTQIVPLVPTNTDQSQRKPGQGGQPAATQVPNSRPGGSRQGSNLPTISLPGIGPVLIDPARTAIVLPGATNALVPGEHTVINGIPVSIDSSGSFVVANGKTVAVPVTGPELTNVPLVVDGTTIAIAQLASMIAPGQVTLMNNIKISLSSDSMTLLVGSEVVPLYPTAITSAFAIDSSAILIAQFASRISLLPSGHGILLPNGQTLTPGQATTINGVPIWLSPSESEVVLAGSTVALPKNPSGDLGDYLSTGVTTSAVATSKLPQYQGVARKQIQRELKLRTCLIVFFSWLMELI